MLRCSKISETFNNQFTTVHRIDSSENKMTSIDLLEERVAELENRIYGSNKVPLIDDPLPENSVVDNLLHVNTLIASALSGREKTNSLVKRLPELNDMLDPSYDGIDLHSEAKLELLLATEPEITKYVQSIERLEELKTVLELDRMRDVPELTPKLSQLTLNYVKSHEKANELSQDIWSVFTEYNNIITSIAKTLIALNTAVTAAERATIPKKQLD